MATVTETASPPVTIPPGRAGAPRGQFARFALVGLLNSLVDVLVLNALVWAWHIGATVPLLAANAVAYSVGAAQSFVLNKRWTFGRREATTARQVLRFAATTLGGIALNDALLWAASAALGPRLGATALWATAAKALAIAGSALISFVALRLWVFAQRPTHTVATPARTPVWERRAALSRVLAHHGLSVVLPAYNEEAVIARTVAEVARTLNEWGADYEIIVVNDGSRDGTGAILAVCAARDPHLRVVTHPTNRGYGAALASGFAAATRDLTCFMDADGQFAPRDLEWLLLGIDEADAVLGFRQPRRDTPLRLLNAWAWGQLVALMLGVRVRDLDCAFKLFHTGFLHAHPPETGSALINAELLHTLQRSGATIRQVAVRHLPRQGGRATGANPHVIFRALRDLVHYARRWRTT